MAEFQPVTLTLPAGTTSIVTGTIRTQVGPVTLNVPGSTIGATGGTITVTPSGNILTIASSIGAQAAGRTVEVCFGGNCQTLTLGPLGTASFTLPDVSGGGPPAAVAGVAGQPRPVSAPAQQAPRAGAAAPAAAARPVALPNTGTGADRGGMSLFAALLAIAGAVVLLGSAASWRASRSRS